MPEPAAKCLPAAVASWWCHADWPPLPALPHMQAIIFYGAHAVDRSMHGLASGRQGHGTCRPALPVLRFAGRPPQIPPQWPNQPTPCTGPPPHPHPHPHSHPPLLRPAAPIMFDSFTVSPAALLNAVIIGV